MVFPVRWAARLTPYGHDTLTYGQSRPWGEPPPGGEEADRQVVELIPSQMAALSVFVGRADRLRGPPADGLAGQVRAPSCLLTSAGRERRTGIVPGPAGRQRVKACALLLQVHHQVMHVVDHGPIVFRNVRRIQFVIGPHARAVVLIAGYGGQLQ